MTNKTARRTSRNMMLTIAAGASLLAGGCTDTPSPATTVSLPPYPVRPSSPSPTPTPSTSSFSAALNGAQEVPAVTTAAAGAGTVILSADMTKATIRFSVNGLSGDITGAHIHQGAADVSGAIVKAIPIQTGNSGATLTWSTTDASQPLTPALIAALKNGELYFNVHTTANPNGEIRGQIRAVSQLSQALLQGSQEVPAVTTAAFGTGVFAVSADRAQVVIELAVNGLSGDIIGAHVHQGPPGVSGAIVRSLTISQTYYFTTGTTVAFGIWNSSDASQPLTPALLTALQNGELYLNVHTVANPNGEIRGQITRSSVFTTTMQGSQEVPPVTTSATGTGIVLLNAAETEIIAAAEATGLSGDMTGAHIHQGASGVSGAIVKPLAISPSYYYYAGGKGIQGIWASTDASQPLTPALVASLKNGDLYMNVHTATNSNGEIRGQLRTP